MSKGKALLTSFFLLVSGVFTSGTVSAYCDRCEYEMGYGYPYRDGYYRNYGYRPMIRDNFYGDYGYGYRDYYYPNYRVERRDGFREDRWDRRGDRSDWDRRSDRSDRLDIRTDRSDRLDRDRSDLERRDDMRRTRPDRDHDDMMRRPTDEATRR